MDRLFDASSLSTRKLTGFMKETLLSAERRFEQAFEVPKAQCNEQDVAGGAALGGAEFDVSLLAAGKSAAGPAGSQAKTESACVEDDGNRKDKARVLESPSSINSTNEGGWQFDSQPTSPAKEAQSSSALQRSVVAAAAPSLTTASPAARILLSSASETPSSANEPSQLDGLMAEGSCHAMHSLKHDGFLGLKLSKELAAKNETLRLLRSELIETTEAKTKAEQQHLADLKELSALSRELKPAGQSPTPTPTPEVLEGPVLISDIMREKHDAMAELERVGATTIELQNLELKKAERRNDELQATAEQATHPLLRQIELLHGRLAVANKTREEIEKRQCAQEPLQIASFCRLARRAQEDEQTCTRLRREMHELKAAHSEHGATIAGLRVEKETLRNELAESAQRLSLQAGELQRLETELEQARRELGAKSKLCSALESRQNELVQEEIEKAKKEWECKDTAEDVSARSGPSGFPRGFTKSEPSLPIFDEKAGSVASLTGAQKDSAHSIKVRMLEARKGIRVQVKPDDDAVEELSRALANLAGDNKRLLQDAERFSALQKAYETLDVRYKRALELLGESSERVEELQTDLAELRAMYRSQIDHLSSQLEKSSQSG